MIDWLFTAIYEDGTEVRQTPEDISSLDPIRSAYYDVDTRRVARFRLDGPGGRKIELDMLTGIIYFDGLKVGLNDEDEPIRDRRLIYFRRHLHCLNVSQEEIGETDHRITYHLGWEGENVKNNTIRREIWVE